MTTANIVRCLLAGLPVLAMPIVDVHAQTIVMVCRRGLFVAVPLLKGVVIEMRGSK